MMIYILKVYLAIGIVTYALEWAYALLFSDLLFHMNWKEYLKYEISRLNWKSVFGVIIAIALWPMLAAIILFWGSKLEKNHDNQP